MANRNPNDYGESDPSDQNGRNTRRPHARRSRRVPPARSKSRTADRQRRHHAQQQQQYQYPDYNYNLMQMFNNMAGQQYREQTPYYPGNYNREIQPPPPKILSPLASRNRRRATKNITAKASFPMNLSALPRLPGAPEIEESSEPQTSTTSAVEEGLPVPEEPGEDVSYEAPAAEYPAEFPVSKEVAIAEPAVQPLATAKALVKPVVAVTPVSPVDVAPPLAAQVAKSTFKPAAVMLPGDRISKKVGVAKKAASAALLIKDAKQPKVAKPAKQAFPLPPEIEESSENQTSTTSVVDESLPASEEWVQDVPIEAPAAEYPVEPLVAKEVPVVVPAVQPVVTTKVAVKPAGVLPVPPGEVPPPLAAQIAKPTPKPAPILLPYDPSSKEVGVAKKATTTALLLKDAKQHIEISESSSTVSRPTQKRPAEPTMPEGLIKIATDPKVAELVTKPSIAKAGKQVSTATAGIVAKNVNVPAGKPLTRAPQQGKSSTETQSQTSTPKDAAKIEKSEKDLEVSSSTSVTSVPDASLSGGAVLPRDIDGRTSKNKKRGTKYAYLNAQSINRSWLVNRNSENSSKFLQDRNQNSTSEGYKDVYSTENDAEIVIVPNDQPLVNINLKPSTANFDDESHPDVI